MAIKPILFNTEMVRAILEGRKTQTRRTVKQPPIVGDIMRDEKGWYYEDGTRNGHSLIPQFSTGDILWVRETWGKLTECDVFPPYEPHEERFIYRADRGDPDHFQAKWHPSIHMPKEAARIFLRVKDVHVERLQDITVLDAISEGCSGVACDCINADPAIGCTDCHNSGWLERPETEFSLLWDSTVKKAEIFEYGWHANPWVWVIEFERCEKPNGWSEVF
jgi:hypothetical protein